MNGKLTEKGKRRRGKEKEAVGIPYSRMARVDVTDASPPSPLDSPPGGRKRPRSLLHAMSAPRAAVALMMQGHKAAAERRSAAQRQEEQQQQQAQKRRRRQPEPQALLPGLPDHLSQLCLSRLPPRLLYSVCRPWRRLLYSPSTPPFPALYALLSTPSAVGPLALEFQSFDPISSKWLPLPSPHPQPTILVRYPAYMSRRFPVQSVAAGDSLVLLAATAGGQEGLFVPALSRPLVFHAPTGTWRHGPPFRPAPRRWCAAGAMQGKVYVASGVTGPDYDAGVARAVHRWDVSSSAGADPVIRGGGGSWEEVAPLKDGRFSRDAVDAVAARGKLYMVNALGGWAREGLAYDPATDRWEDMPPGMLMGWTGPAAAASRCPDGEGNRRRTTRQDCGCAEETIYCVEAADGVLWAYEWGEDKWVAVLASDRLKGAMQLTAGGVGTTRINNSKMKNHKQHLCAVLAGGAGVAVIDVGARRIWEVAPPQGRLAVGVHMLPRMSRPEALVDEEEDDDDGEAEERRRIAATHLADRLPRSDGSH